MQAAVARLLAGEINRLIAEAESLQAVLDDKHATLLWLHRLLRPGDAERQKIRFAAATSERPTPYRLRSSAPVPQ
jgi:hypothetical protein